MAQQEEGWPLGLQPLNVRNRGFNGSISFNTLITSSSSDSSSDLDTESTASFFHDKSITLGSLIGITSILEFSRRSTTTRRRRTVVVETKIRDNRKKINSSNKSRSWLFSSLCSKLSTDAVSMNNISSAPPSLGHFLETERKAAAAAAASYDGPDDFNQLSDDSNVNNHNNSLFIGGQIAPPPPTNDDESRKGLFEQNGHHGGGPLIFSCLCGHLVH